MVIVGSLIRIGTFRTGAPLLAGRGSASLTVDVVGLRLLLRQSKTAKQNDAEGRQ